MRIIAGRYSGRSLAAPRGRRTHPMSDKMRGALFNALGDIEGLSVLDAFAGSGALSFEAVSRGASNATAIDNDKNAQRAIKTTTSQLSLKNQIKLIKAGAGAWLSTTTNQFDLVLLDPPYDDIQPKLLNRLADRAKTDGTVVISLPPSAEFSLPENYELLSRKNYGDAELLFYRKLPTSS